MLDSHIASISLSDAGQGAVGDQPIVALLQVDLSPSFDPSGYSYGFKRVRIRLLLEADVGLEIRERLGRSAPVQLAAARLTARGTDTDPIWELTVDTGILNGEFSTKEQHLFRLINGHIGMEFDVELSAQLYDGSLARSDGTSPKRRVREVIIERLLAKRIGSAPNAHGWLELGKQKLRIVRLES
jgi:hypothetical protein